MASQPVVRMISESDPENHFVAGRITAVEGQDLIVQDEEDLVKRVRIVESTRFWMGRVGAPLSRVRPGDFLYARGSIVGTTLVGKRVYVNIVSIVGRVTRVEAEDHVVSAGSRELRMRVQPETEFFVGGMPRPINSGIPLNRPVQIIGLWDEQDKLVYATRLFLQGETGGQRLAPKPK